jgi:hypothetical protein
MRKIIALTASALLGCWMLLLVALFSNPAFAHHNGLPHGIAGLLPESGGSSGVISANAPPQPPELGRTKFLPPQPEGVIHLNAPSQPRRRGVAVEGFAKKNCKSGTAGCSSDSIGLPPVQRMQTRLDAPRFTMPGGIGGGGGIR